MGDHLSDCSDDSFEIVSHGTCDELENEITSFYKPKVAFRGIFDVYPMDSDVVAQISLTQDFEKSPEDTVIVMPLAWTSMDQGLCSANISGDYVRFDVNDLPKSSADKFYQLCYCAAKNRTIEGVSTPFSFREVHEDELIEFQKEQNKEFWTFRSRFAVLMNIYWNSLVENKMIFNRADYIVGDGKAADAAASFVKYKLPTNEEKMLPESLRSLSIKDSLPQSETALSDPSLVVDKGPGNESESFVEIEKLVNVEDSVAEEKKLVDESDSARKSEEAVAEVVSPVECEEAVAEGASPVECKESTSPDSEYHANLIKYHRREIDGLYLRIGDLERILYEQNVHNSNLALQLQQREKDYEALENKLAVESLFDPYSRSDDTKRLSEHNEALQAQCHMLSKKATMWEDNFIALEARYADLEAGRVMNVERRLADVAPIREDLLPQWKNPTVMHLELEKTKTKLTKEMAKYEALKKEVDIFRKKEESFAIKLVEITAEYQKQLRNSEKIQADLETRLKVGAKEYAKLYLKLQKHLKSVAPAAGIK